eukprot:GEMP01012850.1.p1 GENE.GEMP01012850.1~~GEMP01012850.1.p1  ORF type:complete len:782 (+),score=181.76 GEMP01012850.1:23-2368(+)
MSIESADDYQNFRSFLNAQKQAQPDRVTQNSEGVDVQQMSECDVLRKQGNDLFNLGIFKGAVTNYTAAIKIATQDEMGRLYSNRSVAYLKDGDKEDALADAREAVRLLPTTVKSYNRLCSALLALEQYEECIENAKLGSTFGNGLLDIMLDATRGLFNKLFGEKTLVQDRNGLQVKWSFYANNQLTFDVLQKTIKATYYILPGSLLRISSGHQNVMPSQDYEFKIENEQLWIKTFNATSESFTLLQQEVPAVLDEFDSEIAYMKAWLAVLPDAKTGELSNVTPQDSEQVVQKKSEMRLLLIQELNQLKHRGVRFHGSAMGKVRTGKSKTCRELRRRMVALHLMDAETKIVDAFVSPRGNENKSRRVVISDSKSPANKYDKSAGREETTASKGATQEKSNAAEKAVCKTNGAAVEAGAVQEAARGENEVAKVAAAEAAWEATNATEEAVGEETDATAEVGREENDAVEKVAHEEIDAVAEGALGENDAAQEADREQTDAAEEMAQEQSSTTEEPTRTQANFAQASPKEAAVESPVEEEHPATGNGGDNIPPFGVVGTDKTDEQAQIRSSKDTRPSHSGSSNSPLNRAICNIIGHIARITSTPFSIGIGLEGENYDGTSNEHKLGDNIAKGKSDAFPCEVATASASGATVTHSGKLLDPQALSPVSGDKMLFTPNNTDEVRKSSGQSKHRGGTPSMRELSSSSGLLVIPTIFGPTPRASTNTIMPPQDEAIAKDDEISQQCSVRPRQSRFFTQPVVKLSAPKQPEWLSRMPSCFQGIGRLCWA